MHVINTRKTGVYLEKTSVTSEQLPPPKPFEPRYPRQTPSPGCGSASSYWFLGPGLLTRWAVQRSSQIERHLRHPGRERSPLD